MSAIVETLQDGRGRPTKLARILGRKSPFGNETGELPMGEYEPGSDLVGALHSDTRVLVVGAGGLGCEILKDLALSGFRNIDVIDLDTIDVSNLNRQFLFRKADVGKPKAEVAAAFIRQRIPGCVVNAHVGKIQDKPTEFYQQFKVIVSGLDNIEARRWLNSVLVDLVDLVEEGEDKGEIADPDQVIPFIDGGTEGFKGQARVIVPRITSCFECTLFAFPPQKAFPLCTIAQTPRIPEHCIAYAYIVEWDRTFKRAIDKDSPDDMKWIFEVAAKRADDYGISGVTYFRTMGVVKNIIPAIASTNAIISAACVSEALKIVTFGSQSLNGNMSYGGSEGVYTNTFPYEQSATCIVCDPTKARRKVDILKTQTLSAFMIDVLGAEFQLNNPSVTATAAGTLYMRSPPSLREMTAPNLEKTMGELIEDGDVLNITDSVIVGDGIGLEVSLVD